MLALSPIWPCSTHEPGTSSMWSPWAKEKVSLRASPGLSSHGHFPAGIQEVDEGGE